MKPLTISGTTFYPDDTVEVVRQLIALNQNSHPSRMYVECLVQLDSDHYSANPKNWMALFHRLSLDGRTVTENALRTYVTQIRPEPETIIRSFTLDEWSEPLDELRALLDPGAPFNEWRIFGVPEEESVILPVPPKDIPVPSTRIPIPHSQRLVESVHPDEMLEFRVTQFVDGMSEAVKSVYFPTLRDETPTNLAGLEKSILANRKLLADLFALKRVPANQTSSVLKAKWFVPLVSTKITAPRTRFEQIFYGLTVSKDTPYIAYFTAKTEVVRSKFYVEDPKKKEPLIDTTKLRGWLARTLPQRRRPTLLLYRGKTNTHFDRIAITDTDITFQSERDRDSTETLEELQAKLLSWFQSLDAVVPFFTETDVQTERWDLSELSLAVSYAKEISEFNMNRFHCLHPIFGIQDGKFKLLRADQAEGEVPIEVIQTYQYLQQDPNPEFIAEQMQVSLGRANELIQQVTDLSEDFNFEKYVKQYPTVQFFKRDAYIRFVTNAERVVEYVNLLRHILTSDAADVAALCPERIQEVAPVMAVAQGEIDAAVDLDAEAALLGEEYAGYEFGQEVGAPAAAAPAGVKRKLAVAQRQATTYNYFNNRLKKFDADTFDQSFYNSECEKLKQVVVLTPEDKERIGSKYNYEKAAANQKFELDSPKGTAICPPYWCMRDELPLLKEQLVLKEDGALHCPVCDGKVRPNDSVNQSEFTVIERDQTAKYPDEMKRLSTKNGKKVPCCYMRPPKEEEDERKKPAGTSTSYILQEDVAIVPELRAAFLSQQLADALKLKTKYDTTVKKGKIVLKETDIFRIGLGRPSKSLPTLFGNEVQIPHPREAPESVKKCSFFLTRRTAGGGDSTEERVLEGIYNDYDEGKLTILEEVEYVTTFLECEVLRVDINTNQVLCGFWSDTVRGTKNTIVLLGEDILGTFGKVRKGKNYQSSYSVNVTRAPFTKDTLTYLRNLSKEACNVGIPTYDDAVRELQRLGKPNYEIILDPFKRTQALFVPGELVLPILPVLRTAFEGIPVRNGYFDVAEEELPSKDSIRSAYADSKHPGYKLTLEHANVNGILVELELSSGFRIPIKPEADGAKKPTEILETIRRNTEEMVVEGKPNPEDVRLAEQTTYKTEILEFLLFSLSKDIQTEDYVELRRSIERLSPTLDKDLDAWFKAEGYMDTANNPIQFINKVRTPCGQLTNKDTCNKSSLCGWHRGDCKIRVNPVFTKAQLMSALAKLLKRNPKKRALVLDGVLSPFFSTVLYLEMPNELITTSF